MEALEKTQVRGIQELSLICSISVNPNLFPSRKFIKNGAEAGGRMAGAFKELLKHSFSEYISWTFFSPIKYMYVGGVFYKTVNFASNILRK